MGRYSTQRVLNAVSADETASVAIGAHGFIHKTMIVESSAGVSAGSVTLEAAATAAGPWASIGALTINTASSAFRQLAANDASPFLRARVDTAITGGTVTVYISMVA